MLVVKRTKDGSNGGLAGFASYSLLVRANRFHDGRKIVEPFDPSGKFSARIGILKRGTLLDNVEQLSARHVEVLTDIIVRLDAGLLKLSLKRRSGSKTCLVS